MLVLDDLHGADQPSLLLLGFLAVHLRDTPILVVGTYREAEARQDAQLAGTLGDIIRHGQRLPLRGLRERDVAEVVERVAGRRPPEGVVRAIHHATEGNPFFVDEVVRLLRAEGRLDSAAPIVGLRIPDGVRETIRHRLAPLPDRARILLLTAAVIGREFRLDTLQRVCELEPAELDGALGEAVELGVIVERPATIGAYGFSHGLIRETLYDDVGPQRRGLLHRDVGRALEELYAADPEPHVSELAHHFFVAATAGELVKAIDYSVRAGERAMSLVAYEEASEHFERALQAYGLQERADVPRRCDLLLALGTAQSRAGSARGARETFMRAAGLARRLESPERLARAALGYGAGMGGFEFGVVDHTLIGLLQEARMAFGPDDGPLQARVMGRMATELYFSDRAEERAQLSEDAMAMARRLGDRATIASTLSARLLILWGRRTRWSACRSRPTSSPRARRRAIASSSCAGTCGGSSSLMELGDWVGTDIELSIHARLAGELRDPLHLWYVPLFQANRAMLEGRLDDAERFASEAFKTGSVAQPQNAAQLYAVQLLELRAVQGRVGEVVQSLEEFARRYPSTPVWRAASAFALATVGRVDDARRSFEALCSGGLAGVPRDAEWLSTVAFLVRVGVAVGDARRSGRSPICCAVRRPRDHHRPRLDLPRPRLALHRHRSGDGGPLRRGDRRSSRRRWRPRAGGAPSRSSRRFGWSWRMCGRAVRGAGAGTRRGRRCGGCGARPSRRGGWRLRGRALPHSRRCGEAQAATASASPGRRRPARRRPARPRARPRRAVRRRPAPRAAASTGSPSEPRVAATLAFYRRGDVWTIGPPDRPIQLRHAKGLTHVARLLAAPHVEFHALDLVAGPADRGGSAATAIASGMEVRARGSGDVGPAARRPGQGRLPRARQGAAGGDRGGRVLQRPRARLPRARRARLPRPRARRRRRPRRPRPQDRLGRRARARERHPRDPHGAQAHRRPRPRPRPHPRHRDPHRHVLRLRADARRGARLGADGTWLAPPVSILLGAALIPAPFAPARRSRRTSRSARDNRRSRHSGHCRSRCRGGLARSV